MPVSFLLDPVTPPLSPSLPLGVVASVLTGLLWLSPFIVQPDIPYDSVGVAVFCVAAVTELLTEPLWVLAQMHHYVSLKVAMVTMGSLHLTIVYVPGGG